MIDKYDFEALVAVTDKVGTGYNLNSILLLPNQTNLLVFLNKLNSQLKYYGEIFCDQHYMHQAPRYIISVWHIALNKNNVKGSDKAVNKAVDKIKDYIRKDNFDENIQ